MRCLQLWVAVVLALAGVVLLFMGFWVPPEGEIDSSVLVAFGEVSTFSGALFGVDYSYRWRGEGVKELRSQGVKELRSQGVK